MLIAERCHKIHLFIIITDDMDIIKPIVEWNARAKHQKCLVFMTYKRSNKLACFDNLNKYYFEEKKIETHYWEKKYEFNV